MIIISSVGKDDMCKSHDTVNTEKDEKLYPVKDEPEDAVRKVIRDTET